MGATLKSSHKATLSTKHNKNQRMRCLTDTLVRPFCPLLMINRLNGHQTPRGYRRTDRLRILETEPRAQQACFLFCSQNQWRNDETVKQFHFTDLDKLQSYDARYPSLFSTKWAEYRCETTKALRCHIEEHECTFLIQLKSIYALSPFKRKLISQVRSTKGLRNSEIASLVNLERGPQ